MATPNEQPWSIAEKNYMLAEIIKAHNPPPSVLLNVIASMAIHQPNWNDIPLPPGRSLNSCHSAFEELKRGQGAYALPGTFQPPAHTPTHHPASAPGGLKRSYPFDPQQSFGATRAIRPKPSGDSAFSQMSPIGNPPKKKRGRPTKAEAQAKAEAQTASSSFAPPPPTPPGGPPGLGPVIAASPPAFAPIPAPENTVEPAKPPTTRMPIANLLTPAGPATASQSSSSSGKRRRARSTRSEPEDLPMPDAARARQGQEYMSPYARPAPEAQDTPARAAVLRHREEPEQSQEGGAQASQQPPRSEPNT